MLGLFKDAQDKNRSNKMARAYLVLEYLDEYLEPFELNVWVEAYSNGREQGFCVVYSDDKGHYRNISFSENRRSDSMVVYEDEHGKFSMQGNCPSDEAYQQRKMFDDENLYGCVTIKAEKVVAKHIANTILTFAGVE